MSKREAIRRERRAFEKGVILAFGIFCVSTAAFFLATNNGSIATICALCVMGCVCFEGEIRKDGKMQRMR